MIHSEHIPMQLETELDGVRQQVIRMGRLAEQRIQLVVEAMENGDVALTNRTSADDRHFIEMEMGIGDMCNHILAAYHLTEDVLRVLMAEIKTIAELRRIGDEAEKIAQLIHRVSQQNSTLMLPRYSYMGIKQAAIRAQDLLHKSLDSFAHHDPETAIQVLSHDDDNGFDTAIHFLVSCMIENPRTIPAILEMLLVARAIERIAGHARNVSEHVVYMVRGREAPLAAAYKIEWDVQGQLI